jgi:hypothetical protein
MVCDVAARPRLAGTAPWLRSRTGPVTPPVGSLRWLLLFEIELLVCTSLAASRSFRWVVCDHAVEAAANAKQRQKWRIT